MAGTGTSGLFAAAEQIPVERGLFLLAAVLVLLGRGGVDHPQLAVVLVTPVDHAACIGNRCERNTCRRRRHNADDQA